MLIWWGLGFVGGRGELGWFVEYRCALLEKAVRKVASCDTRMLILCESAVISVVVKWRSGQA